MREGRKLPTFGWDRIKLSALTLAQLAELRERIVNDPENAASPGSVFLHTKEANRKLDALSWAVFNRQKGVLSE